MHESLESILIKPVQRIPRYNLLLEDLLKNTPADHADHPNIQKALGKMKEVADHINKSVQQQENLRRLMEASNKGAGFRVRRDARYHTHTPRHHHHHHTRTYANTYCVAQHA